MTTRFIATTNGHRADGYLLVHNEIYVARSGRLVEDTPAGKTERGEIPPGTYKLGPPMALTAANQLTMTDGQGNAQRFRKFEIAATASNREKAGGVWGVRDKRYPGAPRTNLRFHYDGDIKGSEGCIVYDDERAQAALAAAFKEGDTVIEVIYVETQDKVKELVRQYAKRDPPS
jgi:hypothetical protein